VGEQNHMSLIVKLCFVVLYCKRIDHSVDDCLNFGVEVTVKMGLFARNSFLYLKDWAVPYTRYGTVPIWKETDDTSHILLILQLNSRTG